MVHCSFLPGLIHWDLAPGALRILCLGFYLWCLHVSQLALQRKAQTVPQRSLESRSPDMLLISVFIQTRLQLTLMYFGAAKPWHIDPISGFTRAIPRMPTWVSSCSMTPESQHFALHRDLRIWFYSIVNRKCRCYLICIILRNPLHLDSIKMFDNARGFFRLCLWLEIWQAQTYDTQRSMGHSEQSWP